jgi:hypothetical protein
MKPTEKYKMKRMRERGKGNRGGEFEQGTLCACMEISQ